MSTERHREEAARYAAGVRAALADLTAEQRDALLEDLDDHLAEVAAEADSSLVERLGSPETYAAELRQAYGAPTRRARAELFTRAVATPVRWVVASTAWREVRSFLPELRPAWWVARAYLLVMLLVLVFEGAEFVRLVPSPFTRRGLLQFAATLFAVVASVSIGRRVLRGPRSARITASVGNFALAALSLPLVLHMAANASVNPTPVTAFTGPDYAAQTDQASPLLNIYAFTKDGKPLQDVLLYDQDGKPLTVGAKGMSLVGQVPVDANGQPVSNLYPLNERQPDGTAIPSPQVALPVWPSPAGPTPTPTASPKS